MHQIGSRYRWDHRELDIEIELYEHENTLMIALRMSNHDGVRMHSEVFQCQLPEPRTLVTNAMMNTPVFNGRGRAVWNPKVDGTANGVHG